MKHINKIFVLSASAFLLASCGPKQIKATDAQKVAESLKFSDTKVKEVLVSVSYVVKESNVLGNTILTGLKTIFGQEGGQNELSLREYEDSYFVSNFEFTKRGDENYTYVSDNTAITVDGTMTTFDYVEGDTVNKVKTVVTENITFNSVGLRTEDKYTYLITKNSDTLLD